MNHDEFIKSIIEAFEKIYSEIDGSEEFDVRYRFVKYLLEGSLRHDSEYIRWERKRADITIFDENLFPVVKIETKSPSHNIDNVEDEEYAFKYKVESTKFIGLTNFKKFKLWEIINNERKLILNLNFKEIVANVGTQKLTKGSSAQDLEILQLEKISKNTLFNPNKYSLFDRNYAKIDITTNEGFSELISKLDFIVNTLLLKYTSNTFDEYRDNYLIYQKKKELLRENLSKCAETLSDENLNQYTKAENDLNHEYGKYKDFERFYTWKKCSAKSKKTDKAVKETFCKESIYILLNRLLFTRICEDKELIKHTISDGGIETLIGLTNNRDTAYKQILKWSFDSAQHLYPHFYETGLLDWYSNANGELNFIINRTLWILNQFDFSHVDRDILGELYENYLPLDERKKLGEFYTPKPIIDYILTSIGYNVDEDIENKNLLDPSCGSGGFLVRATRRLIAKYLKKFNKASDEDLFNKSKWKGIISTLSPEESEIIIEAVKKHIHGMDINPFACHIAEMNLLFQIIDLYKNVVDANPEYEIGKFNIYRTDSIRRIKQPDLNDFRYNQIRDEQRGIYEIKNGKFDFVVGNPPYVKTQELTQDDKDAYKDYKTASNSYDIYVLFFELGIRLLKSDGILGFICSNRFTNVNYGKNLRKLILKKSIIEEYVDFKDTGVFKDATNYPSITILKKDVQPNFLVRTSNFYYKDDKLSEVELVNSVHEELHNLNDKHDYSKNKYFETFFTSSKSLSEDGFYFNPTFKEEIIQKLSKSASFLKDLTVTKRDGNALFEGSSTGNKDIFVLDVIEEDNLYFTVRTIDGDEVKIERGIVRYYVEDAGEWLPEKSKNIAIFPYKENEDGFELISEEELEENYPFCYQYLIRYKNNLLDRKIKDKTIWYRYSAPRSLKNYKKEKVMIQGMTDYAEVSLDVDNGFLFGPDIYGLRIKDEYLKLRYYLLALLNSDITNFFIRLRSVIHKGGYYKYEDRFLKNLPVKIPKTNKDNELIEEINEMVLEILELRKKLTYNIEEELINARTRKLYEIPNTKINISDNAKLEEIIVEDSKVFINSKDFIEINDKKVLEFVRIYIYLMRDQLTSNIKNRLFKMQIPESSIINDFLEINESKRRTIEIKIIDIKNAINTKLYELYNLDGSDVSIIENTLNRE